MKSRAPYLDSTIAVLAAAGGLIHIAAAGEDAAPAALGQSDPERPEAVQDCACAASLYKVVFTGARFCCAGQNGTIRTSVDGQWKECPSPTRRALYGVGFGCDGFVAVGAGGVILFSEDGFSWASVESR